MTRPIAPIGFVAVTVNGVTKQLPVTTVNDWAHMMRDKLDAAETLNEKG